MGKVKRETYLPGELSRRLDRYCDGMDGLIPGRVIERMIEEGLERREQELREIQALRRAGTIGTAALTFIITAVMALPPA